MCLRFDIPPPDHRLKHYLPLSVSRRCWQGDSGFGRGPTGELLRFSDIVDTLMAMGLVGDVLLVVDVCWSGSVHMLTLRFAAAAARGLNFEIMTSAG